MYDAASPSKHTVPTDGAAPRAGCGVLSHPAYRVPHERSPGGSDAMRAPAAPSNACHAAGSARVSSHASDDNAPSSPPPLA